MLSLALLLYLDRHVEVHYKEDVHIQWEFQSLLDWLASIRPRKLVLTLAAPR